MISVHYDRKKLDLTVQGHAGYAEPGKDIVCAAVSILTSTLAYILNRDSFESCFEPELSAFRAMVADEGLKKRYRPYFDFTMEGLRMLQAAYPDNIIILEENTCDSLRASLRSVARLHGACGRACR